MSRADQKRSVSAWLRRPLPQNLITLLLGASLALLLLAFTPSVGLEDRVRGHADSLEGSVLICHQVWDAPLSEPAAAAVSILILGLMGLVAWPSTRRAAREDSLERWNFGSVVTFGRRAFFLATFAVTVKMMHSRMKTEAAIAKEMAACEGEGSRDREPSPAALADAAILRAARAHPGKRVAVVMVEAIDEVPASPIRSSQRQLRWHAVRGELGTGRTIPSAVGLAAGESRFTGPGNYVVVFSLAPAGKVTPTQAWFSEVLPVDPNRAGAIADMLRRAGAPSPAPPCACPSGDPNVQLRRKSLICSEQKRKATFLNATGS